MEFVSDLDLIVEELIGNKMYNEALEISNDQLRLSKKIFKEDDIEYLKPFINIGKTYYFLNDYINSEESFKNSLVILEKFHNNYNLQLIETLEYLCRIYKIKKMENEHLDVLLRIKDLITQEENQYSNKKKIKILENIFSIYEKQNNVDKIMETLNLLLKAKEEEYGEEDPSLIENLENLILLNIKYDKNKTTEKLIIQILKIIEKRKDIYYESIQQKYYHLIKLYENANKDTKLLDIYLRLITLRDEYYPKDSPIIFELNSKAADIYHTQNDFTNALKFYKNALRIADEGNIKNYDKLFELNSKAAEICQNREDYSNSLKYYLDALKIIEKNKSKDLTIITNLLRNISDILLINKKFDEAESFLVKLSGYYEIQPPEDDKLLESLLLNLSKIYEKEHNEEDSVDIYKRLLELYENKHGKNSKKYISVLNKMVTKLESMADRAKLIDKLKLRLMANTYRNELEKLGK